MNETAVVFYMGAWCDKFGTLRLLDQEKTGTAINNFAF